MSFSADDPQEAALRERFERAEKCTRLLAQNWGLHLSPLWRDRVADLQQFLIARHAVEDSSLCESSAIQFREAAAALFRRQLAAYLGQRFFKHPEAVMCGSEPIAWEFIDRIVELALQLAELIYEEERPVTDGQVELLRDDCLFLATRIQRQVNQGLQPGRSGKA